VVEQPGARYERGASSRPPGVNGCATDTGCGGLDDARWRSLLDLRAVPVVSTTLAGARCSTNGFRWSSSPERGTSDTGQPVGFVRIVAPTQGLAELIGGSLRAE
jgi:hypothetical protein